MKETAEKEGGRGRDGRGRRRQWKKTAEKGDGSQEDGRRWNKTAEGERRRMRDGGGE